MKIRLYEDMEEIPLECRKLFETKQDYFPFTNLDWYTILSKCLIDVDTKLKIAVVGKGATFSVVVVCREYKAGHFHSPKTLESLSNFYTPLFFPLTDAKDSDAKHTSKVLIKALVAAGSWDMMQFHPMDPDGLAYKGMLEAFSELGWPVHKYFCFGNWYQPITEDNFASYFSRRPSRIRNTLKRKSKKFSSVPDSTIRIISGAEGCKNY